MKNLTIKKLKFHEDMSEETPCFSADLYENGKLVAHISNIGQGGPNEVHPVKGLTYGDVDHLTTLDAECFINTMVEELNFAKKKQTKNFVLKKGDEVYTSPTPKSFAQLKNYGNYSQWLTKALEEFRSKGFVVLNTNL